jgi:single-stranded DNA-binding protein
MSVFVHVSGALGKQPQQRTSKRGTPYLTASLRVPAGNEIEWWDLLVFNEGAQAEMLRLNPGEKLSAQGVLKIEIYRGGDGEPRISRTIIADAVLALRPAPRERKSKSDPRRASAPATAPEFDDGLPEAWGGPNR